MFEIYVIGFLVIFLGGALLGGLQIIDEDIVLIASFFVALFWFLIVPFIIVYLIGAMIFEIWARRWG